MQKQCSKCKQTKDVSEFAKDRYKKSGIRSYCKECGNKQTRRWADANRSVKNERNREYMNRSYPTKRGQRLAYNAKYYREHRERLLEYARDYNRTYFQEHKDEAYARNHKRRVLEKATDDGTVTGAFLKELRENQPNCYICNEPLDWDTPRAVHLEHKTPLSRGGANTAENVAYCCSHCNLSKHAKTEDEYLEVING